MSGGVITAATTIIAMKACFLYFDISAEETIPIFASVKAIIGN